MNFFKSRLKWFISTLPQQGRDTGRHEGSPASHQRWFDKGNHGKTPSVPQKSGAGMQPLCGHTGLLKSGTIRSPLRRQGSPIQSVKHGLDRWGWTFMPETRHDNAGRAERQPACRVQGYRFFSDEGYQNARRSRQRMKSQSKPCRRIGGNSALLGADRPTDGRKRLLSNEQPNQPLFSQTFPSHTGRYLPRHNRISQAH